MFARAIPKYDNKAIFQFAFESTPDKNRHKCRSCVVMPGKVQPLFKCDIKHGYSNLMHHISCAHPDIHEQIHDSQIKVHGPIDKFVSPKPKWRGAVLDSSKGTLTSIGSRQLQMLQSAYFQEQAKLYLTPLRGSMNPRSLEAMCYLHFNQALWDQSLISGLCAFQKHMGTADEDETLWGQNIEQ